MGVIDIDATMPDLGEAHVAYSSTGSLTGGDTGSPWTRSASIPGFSRPAAS